MPYETASLNDPSFTLADDLASLAAERSSDKRVELLRRIAEAYATHAEPPVATERYLFNEVISKLVDKLRGSHRVIASDTLAAMKNLPGDLVRSLASDADIAVAQPMIRDYKAMPEPILVDIARTGSQEHLRVIAARDQVTPPVTDVVVERGDNTVVGILAANNGAQFSDAGMRRLVGKAREDRHLQALLVDRKDLSLTAVEDLLPMINEELARRLCANAARANNAVVKKYLAEWLAERKKNAERTDAYIAGIRKGDLNAGDVLRGLLAQGRLCDVATVLASVLSLDRDYTFGVLAGSNLQSALLLMRAATLSWPVAEAFLKLREAKAAQYEYRTPPTRAQYLALDAGAAQRVVRFAKVRQVTAAN